MAIVIEESEQGRSQGGIINALLWIVFLIMIGVGLYYVFFKKPELVEVATPGDFKNTEELSKIDLTPEEVFSNEQFRNLRSYVTPPTAGPTGRTNPFLGL